MTLTGVNAGAEGTNGATHGASMRIDSLGGVVDGARDEVNDGAQMWTVQAAWAQGVPMRTEGGMGCECRCVRAWA